MELTAKQCTPCQGGIPPMSREEAEKYMPRIPGWALVDNATKLMRTFQHKNFAEALAMTNAIGALCESEDHHADITVGWGYCKVIFQTHKINGLHENDFIMAAKVNEIASQLGAVQAITLRSRERFIDRAPTRQQN